MARLLSCVALLFAAAACGQKGPLYLSDSPSAGFKPPKAETYKPVPYPKEAERGGAAEK